MVSINFHLWNNAIYLYNRCWIIDINSSYNRLINKLNMPFCMIGRTHHWSAFYIRNS